MTNIKLIVGLGNPGSEYTDTRHNVGAWFAEQLAQQFRQTLRFEHKFHGQVTTATVANEKFCILIPSTYMNESGLSVGAIMQFYKIQPQEILVAHDELDFPAGQVKIKEGGGHGGHNGLRDIINKLNSPNFYRLRIGIGHPGHKDKVTPYVLGKPSKHDYENIQQAINNSLNCMQDFILGETNKAIRTLHSTE